MRCRWVPSSSGEVTPGQGFLVGLTAAPSGRQRSAPARVSTCHLFAGAARMAPSPARHRTVSGR